ncbi:MAG: transketolase, partial [Mycoplasma sp.]|nr:transketolase [Mycoplasma sp.]
MDRNLIDQLAIKTLKINGIAAVNRASSGHPGIVLGAATIIHTLFSRVMNYLPSEPTWINRDRFIMSAGHGSALLYSQLRILGLISEEQLKNFRQLGSETAGHPEHNLKLGIEMTTGPLGQGIASAVGVALAEKHLNSKFKEIDHFTYVLCGDGDLQEGISYEAMSFAGHNELNKLIILYDSNDIQLDTPVKKTFSEDIKKRVESQNWDYQLVSNNEVDEIEKAILNAKKSNKPSLIEIKTIIGQDATNQNTPKVHGAPLGNDIDNVIKKLNWTYGDLFFIPNEVKELYKETLITRSRKALKLFNPSSELIQFLTYKYIKIKVELPKNQATRVTSGLVIEYLNDKLPLWIGGSADLSSSTKAKGGDGDFSPLNPSSRNILFGVREFSMAAIANGIALHSQLIPFVSTFAVF